MTMDARCSRWFGLVVCVALVTACGKDADGPAEEDAGETDAAGGSSGTGGGEPQGGGSGESSAGSGGTDSRDGGVPDLDASQDAGDYVPDPEFEGIPNETVVYGEAVAGCLEHAGDDPDTLVLTFGPTLRTMQLAAQDGIVEVNGLKCVGLKTPKHIRVVGGNAADTLIIDFSIGDFPQSLRGGSIQVDLGPGKDTLAVAGTYGDDDVRLGLRSGATVLRFTDGPAEIVGRSPEVLIVSTGPGDDSLDAMGGDAVGTALTLGFTGYSGAGADILTGSLGHDVLHAGEGDDLFRTASTADGGDLYDGGRDIDTLSYELRSAALAVKIDGLANDGEPNERDNVENSVETLVGGTGDDALTGGDANNVLIGGPGDDTLNGGAGDDRFLEKGAAQGTDIMNGGPGMDIVDYGERTAHLVVTLCVSAQTTCVLGACGCAADDGEAGEDDTLANIEGAITGSGNDRLYGSREGNYFAAGAGNDELYGDDGDDTMYGEDGDDVLVGGPGEDLLDGAMGADSFDAGDGQGDICVVSRLETAAGCELY